HCHYLYAGVYIKGIMDTNETLNPLFNSTKNDQADATPPWNYVLPFIGVISTICVGVMVTMFYLNFRKPEKTDIESHESEGEDVEDHVHFDDSESDDSSHETQHLASTSV
ncbi:unnamed protein product, partial [Owenia fusiformis]